MRQMYKKLASAFLLAMLLGQVVAFAAASRANVTGIRFSQNPGAVRIVFDLDQIPEYRTATAVGGTRIILDLPNTENLTNFKNLAIKDPLIKGVSFSRQDDGAFRVTIDLSRNAVYKVDQLANPNRVFIDLLKTYDQKLVDEISPGLSHMTIIRGTERGMITANVLDVDLSAGYRLRPALARGKIVGRETLGGIARRAQALGAVNASYFASGGEVLGLTKIDGKIASTTYLARGAFGVMPDGKPVIGQVNYNGKVVLADGTALPVAAVNAERGEDALVIYNSHYDSSTNTNPYGMEYVVKDGQVVAMNESNSPLSQDVVVVSAHGASMRALADVKVGDQMEIVEDLGDPWNEAAQILGVGPMLVKDGGVYLTTKEERFGSDVAGGRAPRTAAGITKDNRALLVVVDGRQSHSAGFSLLELALFMQELGAVDAVNFDGGGSSEMIVEGEIVNRPSDGSERNIGSALLVLPR